MNGSPKQPTCLGKEKGRGKKKGLGCTDRSQVPQGRLPIVVVLVHSCVPIRNAPEAAGRLLSPNQGHQKAMESWAGQAATAGAVEIVAHASGSLQRCPKKPWEGGGKREANSTETKHLRGETECKSFRSGTQSPAC